MENKPLMTFIIDKSNNKIKVEREFLAPLSKVRSAWTESNLIDQRWAPRPYKTVTKTMDFKEGGHRLYAMVAPDGTEHRCYADYISITPYKNYVATDAFCDKDGKINEEMPRATRSNTFHKTDDSTTLISLEVTYPSLGELEKVIEMGMQEGFTMALGNLDELLSSK